MSYMTLQRVAFIKQEHSVISSYAEGSLSGNTNAFASVSSLVFGVYFIHSYNLWIRAERSFLSLRTYSRHGDACFRYGSHRGIDDVLTTAEEHLRVSCANGSSIIHIETYILEG
jgi:hypothetical protein